MVPKKFSVAEKTYETIARRREKQKVGLAEKIPSSYLTKIFSALKNLMQAVD